MVHQVFEILDDYHMLVLYQGSYFVPYFPNGQSLHL